MLGMNRMIREVYDYRELLLAMVYRDIQVRYKQAVMGVLWAFFMPVLGILAGIMIQGRPGVHTWPGTPSG